MIINKIEHENIKKKDIKDMIEEWRNKKKSERLIDIFERRRNSSFTD